MLRLDIAEDCDRDALLVTVDPVGPTCHRETRSCFDPEGAAADSTTQGFGWLETLWATIAERAATRPDGLLYGQAARRWGRHGRPQGDRATEVLMAAKDDAAGSTSGVRHSRASRPDLSITCSCCSPSATCPPRSSSTSCAAATPSNSTPCDPSRAHGERTRQVRSSVSRAMRRAGRAIRWTFSMAFGTSSRTTRRPYGRMDRVGRVERSSVAPSPRHARVALRSAPTESRGWNETSGC